MFLSSSSLVPLLKNTSHYVRAAAISQAFKGADTESKLMAYSIRTTRYRLIVYVKGFDQFKDRPALPYQRKKLKYELTELYDYDRDGDIEMRNRIKDPIYTTVKRELYSLWFSNTDRDWLVLLDKKPFDFAEENPVIFTTGNPPTPASPFNCSTLSKGSLKSKPLRRRRCVLKDVS